MVQKKRFVFYGYNPLLGFLGSVEIWTKVSKMGCPVVRRIGGRQDKWYAESESLFMIANYWQNPPPLIRKSWILGWQTTWQTSDQQPKLPEVGLFSSWDTIVGVWKLFLTNTLFLTSPFDRGLRRKWHRPVSEVTEAYVGSDGGLCRNLTLGDANVSK